MTPWPTTLRIESDIRLLVRNGDDLIKARHAWRPTSDLTGVSPEPAAAGRALGLWSWRCSAPATTRSFERGGCTWRTSRSSTCRRPSRATWAQSTHRAAAGS